jgi:hypothetical protein
LYIAGVTGYEMLRDCDHVTAAQRAALLRDGSKALARAAEVKPDFFEAMTYSGMLLRIAAEDERDPAKKKALVDRADQLRQRAVEIIHAKKKEAMP